MRRRIENTLILAGLLLGVCWLMFQTKMSRHRMRSKICHANLHEIAKAIQLYTRDYAEFPRVAYSDKPGFPLMSAPYYGWADTLISYTKCYTCFGCLEDPHGPSADPSTRFFTDFWLNRNLAGKNPLVVAFPTQTLLVGDGNSGSDKTDARYTLNQFPAHWITMKTSTMIRHQGGANYLFVDSHVKWLKPQEVTNFGDRPNPFGLQ